jgi:hypothetical protein
LAPGSIGTESCDVRRIQFPLLLFAGLGQTGINDGVAIQEGLAVRASEGLAVPIWNRL